MKLFKDIPRNVKALGFVSLLNDAASEMIYPLLPIFLISVLGAGPGALGVIEGIAETTASLLKLFSGWISDKLKKRKFLILIGYSLAAFGRPLISITIAWWQVAVIRFIDRVGKGVRTSPRDALISLSTPEDIRGKSFGFHRAMDHTGAIIGPVVAMVLLKYGMSLKNIFLWALLPGIITVIIVIFFVREKRVISESKTVDFKLSVLSRNFKTYLFVIILFTLGNSSDAFLILKAKDTGIPIALIPLLWIVLHFVKMSTSVPGGVWSDKIGRRRVIVTGWMVYALIYLGFGFSSNIWQIWGLFALYGIYFGLTEGVEKAFVSDLVTREFQGTAFGFYHLAVGIAAFPSSVIFGFIWQRFGSLTAFTYGASLAGLASILLLSFVREKERIK
ncbi:MAG: MFS transporter [Candidatus Stahlbacteria bacterium]|nr:MAG: MFS transporter [Candidatus Stahlbacteria bacterium]